MNVCIQLVKWTVVPALMTAQVALDANGVFQSEAAIWGFVFASGIVLLFWRHRLGKLTSRLTNFEMPYVEDIGKSDRRFAFLSLSLPLVLLFGLQLTILALIALEIPWARHFSGTLWTIFAISAVGFYQIALGINCFTVTHCSRWHRILKTYPPRSPIDQKC